MPSDFALHDIPSASSPEHYLPFLDALAIHLCNRYCTHFAICKRRWSAVNRHERYKNRCGGTYVDEDNPLPGWMDPITLEPAVSPAISPWGHIMGMATWKVGFAAQTLFLHPRPTDLLQYCCPCTIHTSSAH